MSKLKSISVNELRLFSNLELGFSTTDELDNLEGILGQDRAVDALSFGMKLNRPGYNMYLMGSSGLGKHSLLQHFFKESTKDEKREMYDWCYVFNFQEPQKPKTIQLVAGQGKLFRNDMQQLAIDLETAIPNAFETEQYHNRLIEVREDLQEKTQKAFNDLTAEAERHHVLIVRRGEDLTFFPSRNGKALTIDEYEKLSEKEKNHYQEVISVLEERLQNIFILRSQWQKEATEAIKDINREVGMFAVGHLIYEVKERYKDNEKIQLFLNDIQEDVIANLHDFRMQNKIGLSDSPLFNFQHYEINLIVDNSETKGIPIIYEDNPLYQVLLGQVEYIAQMGNLITDYQLIKAGSLHKANGGYLVIDANKLLLKPYAWEALKRTMYAGEINIQSLASIFGLVNTVSLEPEPIPLDVKIILVGTRALYYLLEEYDEDFDELFKVEVDFSESIELSDETLNDYTRLIATLVRKNNLLAFDKDAVLRVLWQAMRDVEDKQRISSHMRSMTDLLFEADYWAKEHQQEQVREQDVLHAIDKQVYRADRSRERIYDEIKRGTINISVTGNKVATVNGLFVIEMGRIEFSQPARITATVRLGDGDIIDIEREVELGGAIHTKGVLILSSYLGSRYARKKPLSLNASLVFEQSYGHVDGDSATVGELCAILSAIAEIPVKQSLAITGSANQLGEVQAIGGVNEKIEGFFDVCSIDKLTGEQGVIIPADNVKHLVLREDVIEAVEQGKFNIYPIETIDDAISLLTGMDAGERNEEGEFAEGTVNYKVEQKLLEMAELKHESHKEEHESEHSESSENKNSEK